MVGLAHERRKKSPPERKPIKMRSVTNRARITNGRGLLPSIDGRCVWARRFHDLLALHLSDLGGEDNCSEGEKALVRRAATLICELEHMETLFAQAGAATPFQLKTYQMVTNTLRRVLESLSTGLPRRAKDVTPTLGEYVGKNYSRNTETLEDA
jgi:hypothetical protein